MRQFDINYTVVNSLGVGDNSVITPLGVGKVEKNLVELGEPTMLAGRMRERVWRTKDEIEVVA